MTNIAVTNLIHSYHTFEREFWLSYKALEASMDSDKWEMIKTTLLKSKRVDDKILSMVDKDLYELKRAEIDADWTKRNEDAKATGTLIHEMIHNELVTNIFNARREFLIQGDVQSTDTFLMALGGLFPEQRIEQKLDDEYQLVGIADLISIHDGVFDIIDWKTDDDGIKFKSHFDMSKKHAKKMKYPLTKYDDANGIHYQLQLSLYAWLILQLRPDLNVGKLKLCWVKDMKLKKVYEVEYLKDDIEKLLKWHLKSIKLKQETEKCKEIIY